jgi:1,2-diacylglycerol 3-beta-galactosyltransferase
MNVSSTARVPLLFLIADTGGGHRTAARAVGQALDRLYPGRFAPVLCDPLGGPGSARLLRMVTGWYGPAIRWAPWLWGAAYHACDSRPAMRLLRWALLRFAERPVADAVRTARPAAIVSFHPLTGAAATRARTGTTPVITVVTDLARTHASWRHAEPDLLIGPPASLSGPPVTREYWAGPLAPPGRMILRRSLGLSETRFLILLAGGGEGSGGLGRRTAAILRRFDDVDVVAVCGRNRRLKRRLDALAARSGSRLTVTGFTAGMSALLRCCDLVVTKAGPGTIAEAACCGAPMLLTAHVPGQEAGNAEVVIRPGAGRRARSVRRLLTEIARLRADQASLAGMRAASAHLGQPGAALTVAGLIADLIESRPGQGSEVDQWACA